MGISVTYHGDLPKQATPALGAQIDDAFTVNDGDVSAPLGEAGLYRIKALDACVVRFGLALTDASGGEDWADGHVEVRHLRKGSVIAVDAA